MIRTFKKLPDFILLRITKSKNKHVQNIYLSNPYFQFCQLSTCHVIIQRTIGTFHPYDQTQIEISIYI